MELRNVLLSLFLSILCSSATSDLVILKCDRRVDLTSHVVRASTVLKVENAGPSVVSQFFIALPNYQAAHLAYLKALSYEGKGKSKGSTVNLSTQLVQKDGTPPDVTMYSVSLQKELNKGESLTLTVLSIFTHSLKPFPEEITQADVQLVLYQETAYYLSPYEVQSQSLALRVPGPRVESYTKLPLVKFADSEIKYGPFENLPAFSFQPIVVHFENDRPFAIGKELVRVIEVSHWGNVQVTEHYNLIHGGAQNKGGFSRIDYQARPNIQGVSSFRHLIARLPPRAHSIYYRDEIGNISTSRLYSDSRKTELLIEPRYPMFGGWKTAFTIGYGLPLKDFLFQLDGKHVLNFTFGCPFDEVVIDKMIIKVILPEGSKDISVSIPFHAEQSHEMSFLHLDYFGRPTVVLEKENVVPEHNQYFQVSYKFNSLAMLLEPLMLVTGFFLLFAVCMVYTHMDIAISKSSSAYLAKLQYDEVQTALQQVQDVITHCIGIGDKLEASLRELSRTGDIQACKAVRKVADGSHKDLLKELKPVLSFLQSSPQAATVWPKVDELIVKEKDKMEKLLMKHSTVLEGYEKKSNSKDITSRVAAFDQKIAALSQDVDDLLDAIE